MSYPTRPDWLADFAATGQGYSIPDAAKRADGFHASEKPFYQFFNALFRYSGLWHAFNDQLMLGLTPAEIYEGIDASYDSGSYHFTAGSFINNDGQKIIEDGTSTVAGVVNSSGTAKIDAILIDLSEDTPTYTYQQDWLGISRREESHTRLVCLMVVPNATAEPTYILRTPRHGTPFAYNVQSCVDGITGRYGTNVTALDDLLLAVNQLGGGTVYMRGQTFVLPATIRLRSGVTLDGNGIARLYARRTGTYSGETDASMIYMSGLYQKSGTISDGYTLTMSDDVFSRYGVGSMVIFADDLTEPYWIASLDDTTKSCALVAKTGLPASLPAGATVFDLYLVGARMQNLSLVNSNSAVSAMLTLDMTFNGCGLSNVRILNESVGSPANISGIITNHNNYRVILDAVKIGDDASDFDYAIGLGAVPGENDTWEVSCCKSPCPVDCTSTGSGVGNFHDNDFSNASVVLPGADSGWRGSSELAEHEVDGSHAPAVITRENLKEKSSGRRSVSGSAPNRSVAQSSETLLMFDTEAFATGAANDGLEYMYIAIPDPPTYYSAIRNENDLSMVARAHVHLSFDTSESWAEGSVVTLTVKHFSAAGALLDTAAINRPAYKTGDQVMEVDMEWTAKLAYHEYLQFYVEQDDAGDPHTITDYSWCEWLEITLVEPTP